MPVRLATSASRAGCGSSDLSRQVRCQAIACSEFLELMDSDAESAAAMASGMNHASDMYERLLMDDQFKDTSIEFSDGTLRAHAGILAAASEAIRGIFSHGTASVQRELSWTEHGVDVGRFFLRLLYTGCACPDEWRLVEGAGLEKEPPIRLLLGALAIAQKYLFVGVLEQVVRSLKKRTNGQTFDQICSAAIRHDVQCLRMHCFMLASSAFSTNGPFFPGMYRVIHRANVRDKLDVRSTRTDDVQPGTVVEVVEVRGQRGRVISPTVGWVSIISTSGQQRLLEHLEATRIRDDYRENRLSPEVMHELLGLHETGAAPKKRRRCRV
mmetsp:Transcript_51010/g.157980  ORF Transcript_51010/g.157980 Transcript_51010/m.157980 type:complete len:326 (-) Transcript_51010:101-1078(-)